MFQIPLLVMGYAPMLNRSHDRLASDKSHVEIRNRITKSTFSWSTHTILYSQGRKSKMTIYLSFRPLPTTLVQSKTVHGRVHCACFVLKGVNLHSIHLHPCRKHLT